MGDSLTALSDDGMLSALSSAASGMRAATLRLETSARKIAHVSASGAVPVGRLTGPQTYLLLRLENSSPVSPAISAGSLPTAVRNVSPTWVAAYAPATAEDLGASPGPNLEDAILEQVIAKNDFVANARTFEAAQAMVKQLFDLSD